MSLLKPPIVLGFAGVFFATLAIYHAALGQVENAQAAIATSALAAGVLAFWRRS